MMCDDGVNQTKQYDSPKTHTHTHMQLYPSIGINSVIRMNLNGQRLLS